MKSVNDILYISFASGLSGAYYISLLAARELMEEYSKSSTVKHFNMIRSCVLHIIMLFPKDRLKTANLN